MVSDFTGHPEMARVNSPGLCDLDCAIAQSESDKGLNFEIN